MWRLRVCVFVRVRVWTNKWAGRHLRQWPVAVHMPGWRVAARMPRWRRGAGPGPARTSPAPGRPRRDASAQGELGRRPDAGRGGGDGRGGAEMEEEKGEDVRGGE